MTDYVANMVFVYEHFEGTCFAVELVKVNYSCELLLSQIILVSYTVAEYLGTIYHAVLADIIPFLKTLLFKTTCPHLHLNHILALHNKLYFYFF